MRCHQATRFIPLDHLIGSARTATVDARFPGSHKVPAGMDSIKNYLLHVHDDVNYDIIFFAQLFGVFVCALLYWLQEYYSASFEGYFVIFLPFIPAVLRQYFVRERWKKSKFKTRKNKKE